MARKVRMEFAGAVYHVLDRGDRREAIFRDEKDRELFLAILGEVCGRTGWRVHAWVLMGNHYHLLLETPEPNLVAGMRWLQTTYTVRFNRRHGLCGHLFQGRYKAVIVDPAASGYFAVLSDYIHLNPVRARLVGPEDRLVDYCWSSYRAYVTGRQRPEWLEVDRVLGEMGVEDTAGGRRHYAERMRERAVATLSGKDGKALLEIRRSWCMGGESFREQMLQRCGEVGEKLRRKAEVDAPVRRGHDVMEAKRLIAKSLAYLGLEKAELALLAKGDVRKLAIARLVRERTSVPRQWIAQEVMIGHVSRLSSYELASPEVIKLTNLLLEISERGQSDNPII